MASDGTNGLSLHLQKPAPDHGRGLQKEEWMDRKVYDTETCMQRSTLARSMSSLLSPWAAAITLFQPLSAAPADASCAEDRKGSERVEKALPEAIASLQKGEGRGKPDALCQSACLPEQNTGNYKHAG